MNEILDRIYKIGIVPVIAIDQADDASELADALCRGGLPVAEVTFRTQAGCEAIRNIAKSHPEVLLGAGTVTNIEQVKKAVDNGASYIVSPGFDEEVVEYCLKRDIPVLPGCDSATLIMKAANAGLQAVKIFPAEELGGLPYIKSLAPVFPGMRFVPTGGINAENIGSYLSDRRILACGGTWMVKKKLITEKKWEEIAALCREAVRKADGFKFKHIGINCEGEAEAENIAKQFCELMGLEYRPGKSVFAGEEVECCKSFVRGVHGHIAVGVNNLDRAIYHLECTGRKMDATSVKYNEDGTARFAFMQGEIGGFAVHFKEY